MSDAASGLWEQTKAVTRRARVAGALQPIETECEYYLEAGVQFVLRRAVARASEARDRGGEPAPPDPFLPYERALYVGDLGDDHVALLNKYAVFAHHLLIITREYEDQDAWLTPGDFRALWQCMGGGDVFGFYNGGRTAGASQAHKHLQVVPLPLAGEGPAVPLAALVPPAASLRGEGAVPGLPYVHALAAIPRRWWEAPGEGARSAFECYRSLLHRVGLCRGPALPGRRQTGPYNLLVTPSWMMLVPRRREAFHAITINSLGLAGALLVRDGRQLAVLKRYGPMAALAHVTVPR